MAFPAYDPPPDGHEGAGACSAVVYTSIDRVWSTVEQIDRWPGWNPLVEWVSDRDPEDDSFNLISAGTLFRGQIIQRDEARSIHWRCVLPDRPDLVVTDQCVSLVARGPDQTLVLARFDLRPWFLRRLKGTLWMDGPNPAEWFVRALRAASEPPSSHVRRRR